MHECEFVSVFICYFIILFFCCTSQCTQCLILNYCALLPFIFVANDMHIGKNGFIKTKMYLVLFLFLNIFKLNICNIFNRLISYCVC